MIEISLLCDANIEISLRMQEISLFATSKTATSVEISLVMIGISLVLSARRRDISSHARDIPKRDSLAGISLRTLEISLTSIEMFRMAVEMFRDWCCLGKHP